MVIVASHAIVSAFLYRQDPERFHGGKSHFSSSATSAAEDEVSEAETLLQEVTLKFMTCLDLQELTLAVRDAVALQLSQSKGSLLYFTDESDQFYCAGEGNIRQYTEPPPCVRKAFSIQQMILVEAGTVGTDVLCQIQHNNQNPVPDKSPIVCFPVLKSGSDSVVAVLMVLLDSYNKRASVKISWLQKQIAACYNHIQRTFQPNRGQREERATQAIIKLCGELYDQDAAQLQLKVLKFLEEQTQAECAFLLLVVPETQELFCQVIGNKVLQDEIRFPGQSSSFAVALETKQPIGLEDIPVDNRKGIEELLEKPLNSLLCVPVTGRNDNNLIAIACVANKRNSSRFTDADVSCIHQCFRYTATVLTSTLAFQNERKLKVQTQAMLQVARHLFTNLGDLTKLLREIMQQARNLSQAERCSVFLIDKETEELVAKVFDGITPKDNEVQSEIRLPISQGIAGHVATTGELLNIKDAYSHPLFYRGIDDSTGFRTRNILCFPIKDEKGVVLGVAQLCNKKTGPCFTTFDEEISTAFGIYCCISISHSLMYKKVIDSQVRSTLANELMMYHMECLMYKKLQDSQHRKSLANELMIYHMQVNQDDVASLTSAEIPNPRLINNCFDQFTYAPRTLPENNTSLSCLSMFEDLGFLSRWRIRRDTLARFVLMVRKGYRNPPYHNWMHAYTVAHFCFLLIKNLHLEKQLDEIELFTLFVACLCHDIDHRGTNNSFQVASKSVLAALYSSEGSVLERHHFAQTMCILNTEGCNVFENLSSKEYQQALDLTREIILATDLAHHLKIMKNLKEMAETGYDSKNPKNHKLLLCLLMTACDLSDQTKPWDNTKHVAALIYKEFFSQGDLEKAQGKEPIEMMDRERAQIPALQIGFLDHVAYPVYKLLGDMFPEANEVANAVQDNCNHWEKISMLIKMRRGGSSARMTFDEVLAIENEENDYSHQNGKK